jgi:hypothetical protein
MISPSVGVLLAAALATAPAPANQFNLECKGTLSSESFYAGKKAEPYAYTYRIDLSAKKYCDGECKVLRDVADVQPTVIVLEPDQDISSSTEKKFSSGSIDRETGRHSVLVTSGRREDILILRWEGQCERQPFSGFPSFPTKF